MTLSKNLLVRISENVLSELKQIAKNRNQTVSYLLRCLIKQVIENDSVEK